MKIKHYYFGCIGEAGHYFHPAAGSRVKRLEEKTVPWGYACDGKLQPDNGEIQGQCLMHYKDGWTAMAFWDRTGDSRHGSCAVVITNSEKTFDEMVSVFQEQFPDVYKRVMDSFKLILHKSQDKR